jgi:hypothetical protein
MLKSEAHPEFHDSRSTQAKNACPLPDAEIVGLGGAVDGAGTGIQPACHGSRRQVEIGKVECVEKAHTRFKRQLLVERVRPTQLKVERPQPPKWRLVGGRSGQCRCYATERKQLICGKEVVADQDLPCRRRLIRNRIVVNC